MPDIQHYEEMFDYLRGDRPPTVERSGLLVFGRKDPLLGQAIAGLCESQFASFVVVSGGVGKDSGDLKIPEAEYVVQTAEQTAAKKGITLAPIFTDTQARNGAENVVNGLTIMRRGHLDYGNGLTTLAHATSARRLNAMTEQALVESGESTDRLFSLPTEYHFDPTSAADQAEARAELLRLAEWPAQYGLPSQLDLPTHLVDFAREQNDVSR